MCIYCRYRRKKGDGRTQQQNGDDIGMRQLDNDALTDHYTNIGKRLISYTN
jgi:hypothetical protein